MLPVSDSAYRAKDIEEMNGHFLMFNHMLKTLDEELSEDLIKKFHYELKSGVFEDKANGYNIGEYKVRPNIAGTMQTSMPGDVPGDMKELLKWYENADKNLILYREALKHDIIPPIIHDENRVEYTEGVKEYAEKGVSERMCSLLKKEQVEYEKTIIFFLG